MDSINPKQLVAESYDRIGARYAEEATPALGADRGRYTAPLVEGLPAGAGVLDLGCGAGVPTTRRLAERFDVTGVDISSRQIERARRNVLSARFIHADMTGVYFPPAAFDGVTALFSIIHVPRREGAGLLGSISSWLRPGGLFVAVMSRKEWELTIDDWLGAPMYWSGLDDEANRRLVEEAGLAVETARIEKGGVAPHRFLWIIARKPA